MNFYHVILLLLLILIPFKRIVTSEVKLVMKRHSQSVHIYDNPTLMEEISAETANNFQLYL